MTDNKIRLQKILSDNGIASRRKSEDLINSGHVKVNGHIAKIGDKVDPKHDVITVNGKRLIKKQQNIYIMLHKPRGYVTTMSDEQGRKCVADLIHGIKTRIYPIGRLDRNSEGLILLTNDGEFANAMMHPSKHVPKTYRVTVRQEPTDEQLEAMRNGIIIDGVKTLPAQVSIHLQEPERTVLEIVLIEGRNRQIRKMCEELGLDVARLRRISIGGVKLGMLAQGKWRELTEKEVALLMSETGMNMDKQKIDKSNAARSIRRRSNR